eukprot:3309935-Amphidinium_carterae.6
MENSGGITWLGAGSAGNIGELESQMGDNLAAVQLGAGDCTFTCPSFFQKCFPVWEPIHFISCHSSHSMAKCKDDKAEGIFHRSFLNQLSLGLWDTFGSSPTGRSGMPFAPDWN